MIKGKFNCIDAHTCGNPVRLVRSGGPKLMGLNMSEKRQDFLNNHDWIRTSLMFEPRGHAMMSGGILYPAISDDADASILFIETSGCLPMCGHGTIGVVTAALEGGLIVPRVQGKLILDVPAGKIRVDYGQNGNKVDWVRLYNVPSFLIHQGVQIDCPGLGELFIDVAYGGNFYAIVDPQKNFSGLQDFSARQILQVSPLIRNILNQQIVCLHPLDNTVSGVSHLLWTGQPRHTNSDGANAVFYGSGAIDRSPCGTGTSARLAQLVAKGLLQVGDSYCHESIIGSQFTARVEEKVQVGEFDAIIPSIRGWAQVTGNNSIVVDDADPYWKGFEVS
jgi:4-hydroxyproline epimerase